MHAEITSQLSFLIYGCDIKAMRKNQASHFLKVLLPPWVAIFEDIKVSVYEPLQLFYELVHGMILSQCEEKQLYAILLQ